MDKNVSKNVVVSKNTAHIMEDQELDKTNKYIRLLCRRVYLSNMIRSMFKGWDKLELERVSIDLEVLKEDPAGYIGKGYPVGIKNSRPIYFRKSDILQLVEYNIQEE